MLIDITSDACDEVILVTADCGTALIVWVERCTPQVNTASVSRSLPAAERMQNLGDV
jgi:hypothetical protein